MISISSQYNYLWQIIIFLQQMLRPDWIAMLWSVQGVFMLIRIKKSHSGEGIQLLNEFYSRISAVIVYSAAGAFAG